jgi:hypothetical protein
MSGYPGHRDWCTFSKWWAAGVLGELGPESGQGIPACDCGNPAVAPIVDPGYSDFRAAGLIMELCEKTGVSLQRSQVLNRLANALSAQRSGPVARTRLLEALDVLVDTT